MTPADLHDNPASTPSEAAESGNLAAEFAALVSGCGLYSLPGKATISITGGDRVRWLNGMVTNNIRDLAVGQGAYAFLLNPQGHILGDLYAYNRGESLLAETDQLQLEKILATFDHYIIMDDVEITNLAGQITGIGIAGPAARKVLQDAGVKIPAEPLQFVEENGVTVVRGDNPAVETYELWMSSDASPAFRERITKAGAIPVGAAAIELLRVASGVPRYGQDIRERDLPQETEQLRAVHFSKGCYIGQEIVERIRSRGSVHRKFTGFILQGPLPPVGTKLQFEGKDIGELTSVATVPLAGAGSQLGLGYVRREASEAGKRLGAGSAKAIVADLPFKSIFET